MAKTPAPTSRELIAQAEALQAQARALMNKEKPAALAQVRQLVAAYGFTAAELGLGGKPGRKPKSIAATSAKPRKKSAAKKKGAGVVKYRDQQGNSWTGFGPKPKWFKAALDGGASLASLSA